MQETIQEQEESHQFSEWWGKIRRKLFRSLCLSIPLSLVLWLECSSIRFDDEDEEKLEQRHPASSSSVQEAKKKKTEAEKPKLFQY